MASFLLRILPGSQPNLIISVSKKVAKKAVIRNLIKRRVRAATRSLVPSLKPQTYMIIAKPGAEKVKGEELKSELIGLIRSIRN